MLPPGLPFLEGDGEPAGGGEPRPQQDERQRRHQHQHDVEAEQTVHCARGVVSWCLFVQFFTKLVLFSQRRP